MLVTCQKFGVLILFWLVWQYSSVHKKIIKVGSKSWLLTCISNITLSLPLYTCSALKRELNFCNGYLSLLYFWTYPTTTRWRWRVVSFELNLKLLPSSSKSSEVLQKLIDLNERFNDQADLIQDTRSLLLNSSILQISHDNDEVIILRSLNT